MVIYILIEKKNLTISSTTKYTKSYITFFLQVYEETKIGNIQHGQDKISKIAVEVDGSIDSTSASPIPLAGAIGDFPVQDVLGPNLT